jgi:hypothetical protein
MSPPDALLRGASAVRDNFRPFPLYAAAQTGREQVRAASLEPSDRQWQ